MKACLTWTVLAVVVALAAIGVVAANDGMSPGCVLADEALRSLGEIRPGVLRSAVERDFARQDGMNFRNDTYYVFRKCEYIKVRIGFSADPDTSDDYSAKDVVTSVSQLSLEYPVKD